jgi:hypothetical protein
MGGDRSSSTGSSYQVEFDVMAGVEDGQSVRLNITNPDTTQTVVSGTALNGAVQFNGVTLAPDGNYTVEARCTNKAGAVGVFSMTYSVDSTPPVLTVSSPMDGKFFGPTELTNGSFQVCARTADKDATSDTAKNLSVAVGTGSPDPNSGYAVVPAVNTDACVSVACTSATPVDLKVTLKDSAGNPTTKTISQISCATSLPGVQIVSPPSDASPFSDPTKRLLASTSGNTLKDQDGARAGAQWNVVACSDKAGNATLLGGPMGGTLASLGAAVATVAAVAADNCPVGYANVAKFNGATLPESLENADGTLATATELRVDVVTPSVAQGSSPRVDLWVDSTAPNVQQYSPSPLCGLVHQSPVTWTTPVQLISTSPTVMMTVTSAGGARPYPLVSWANSFANFGNVTFFLGANEVTATATDAAGNSADLMSPCTVTVGTPPVVTFATPIQSNTLCASTSTTGTCVADANAGTAGWQGMLAVDVMIEGVPATTGTVSFSAGTTDLGTVNINGSGRASLANVTIPDGRGVTIAATTSDISSHGIGMAAETLVVDTVLPDAVPPVTAAVKDRRQTSFHLAWTAPADGGQPLFSYLIKSSKAVINAGNFDAATAIAYTGTPAAPGSPDGIDVTNRLIENNYYFAVAAVDAAGNRGSITTAGPTIAHFNRNILLPPAGGPTDERFGFSIDGIGDLDGDGKSDILVAAFTGLRGYVFFGSSNFDMVSAPSVTITGPGPASAAFGRQFIDIGDIDADGRDDFALSAPLVGNGKIYIFRGRATWNANYTAETEADYIIELDSSYAGKFLGGCLTRLGDFNGDGVDDFAAGAAAYAGGGRVVIFLGKAGFTAAGVNTMIINGDPAFTAGAMGSVVLGVGRFFSGSVGTTLVASATAAGANSRGRVYAFQGMAGTSGTINATMARNFIEGPDNSFYGTSLGLLGGLTGVPGVAIGAGKTIPSANGVADLYFGSDTMGPFSVAPLRFTDSLANAGTDLFGRVIVGGAFAGTSVTASLIGDSRPDVIMAPFTESAGGPSRVYIVDGNRLSSLPSPSDVVNTADVILPLAADWKSLPLQRNGLIKDLNGDGYGDFAIGENIAGGVGRLAVYW